MKTVDYTWPARQPDGRADSRNGKSIDVYEAGVPGLIVHRKVKDPASWTVTHALSGLEVARPLRTRRDALEWAERLGSLRDWRRPLPQWDGRTYQRLSRDALRLWNEWLGEA